MAESVSVGTDIPCLVEKVMEMQRARVENPLLKKPDEFAQPLLHARTFPDAIKIRVGFQNVKMIVHGLLLVHVLVAQPRVRAGFRPVTIANFDVAAKFRVMRVELDQFKHFFRARQRRRAAEGAMKFRQRVNAKRLAVDFFGIINHPAGVIQSPERAAVFRIPEFAHYEIKRAVGHLLKKHFRLSLMDGRKRPNNSGIDDEAFWLRTVGLEIVRQPAHPAALFVIQRRAAPEGEDVAEQLIFDEAGKNLQFG